jgi:hypothetical protein
VILLRPAAAGDIESGYRWYEQQRSGFGDEFLAGVQTARGGGRSVDDVD